MKQEPYTRGQYRHQSLDYTLRPIFGVSARTILFQQIERAFCFGKPGPGGGLIIRLSEHKFLLVGQGFQASFKSLREGVVLTGILSAQELGVAEGGDLRTLRFFKGDETRGGLTMVMPNKSPDYGDVPIATNIPARTGIAQVELYSLLWGKMIRYLSSWSCSPHQVPKLTWLLVTS